MAKEKEKVYWLINSEENKPYKTSTYYRSVGIEDFIKLVEKKSEIVGITFEGNNIGFILNDKTSSQEKSPIKCPNCNCEMDLVVEGDKKISKCENCNYEEPNYNSK